MVLVTILLTILSGAVFRNLAPTLSLHETLSAEALCSVLSENGRCMAPKFRLVTRLSTLWQLCVYRLRGVRPRALRLN